MLTRGIIGGRNVALVVQWVLGLVCECRGR
jgi:hypothetical protein